MKGDDWVSNAIKRLGELRVESFVEGVNNNWLVYKPLPNAKMHSSAVDGTVFLSATPSIEVVDVDLDVPLVDDIYAYSIGTDNKLKIAFSKDLYSSKSEAVEALKCVSVTYETGNLVQNGHLYVLTVKNSRGEEIHRTTPDTLDNIKIVISTFNNTRATDYDGGYLEYSISPDYIVT